MIEDRFMQTHNQILIEEYNTQGPFIMGPYSSYTWRHDPRHLLFSLARYKFCSKMLTGKRRVLEVGCGDGLGTQLMLQTVGALHGIDLEPVIITDNIQRYGQDARLTFEALDITASSPRGPFDAAYSLDVIEHIPQERERAYMDNICASLVPDGTLILGTPNITANAYASQNSRDGHINLKSHDTLGSLLQGHFRHVLLFGMNDEIVHTGFHPMAHFLFGIGMGVR